MKKTLLVASILGAVSAMSSTSAMAVEGLSANVGMTSNYFWRGNSESGDKAAVSGGIDYAAASGLYVGTWVSNTDGDTETDLYVGFGGETDSFSYDVGYVYFNYPNYGSVDFGEVYGSVSFGALTLGLAVLANTEGDNGDFGDSTYVSADYAVEVAEGLELGFHIGSYDGDFVEGSSYEGIDVGVTLSKDGFTFGLIETDVAGQGLEAYVSYSMDIDL